MSNQYGELARQLTVLAKQFERAAPPGNPRGIPDSDILREAAKRLQAQPCDHLVAEGEPWDEAYCRFCGVRLYVASWTADE